MKGKLQNREPRDEMGLPTADDLTPLSQSLIPPELASAFSISPEPLRTVVDVNRESQGTISTLRGGSGGENGFNGAAGLTNGFSTNNNFKSYVETRDMEVVGEAEEEDKAGSGCGGGGSDARKLRRTDSAAEEADSAARTAGEEDQAARTLKRPRLVWTPQLHKRFVDVVTHLGIKNAVPKTIMQLMNVEGLTRENVASHLQKYRLYLKRMQGFSSDGQSSTDHLFASTPVQPQSLHDSGGGIHGNGGHMPMPIQMPYGAPMMPMPVFGHMGMQVGNQGAMGYHDHYNQGGGFEPNPYMLQQKDWSGNKYGSMASYPHVSGRASDQ